MIKDAEANAEADRRRRELVETRNQADAAVYTAERALSEAEGRVPDNVKSEVGQAIAAVKEAMGGEDVHRIRQAAERLAQVIGSIAEAARTGTGGGSQDQAEGARSEDERPGVVDAEFEETDKPDDRRTG